MTIVLLALSCKAGVDTSDSQSVTDPVETDDSGLVFTVASRWEGTAVDDQFGSALATDGTTIWVGAPGSGHVYALSPWRTAASVETVLALPAVRLGHALAVGNDGVIVGAPLHREGRGALYDLDGTMIAEGDEYATMGASMGSTEGSVVANAGESVWTDGGTEATGSRVRGSALVDGVLVAIGTDEPDELGHAVCSEDLDGDGDADLAVGAPGADRVEIWLYDDGTRTEVLTFVGGGRFGQALACTEGKVAVGAPATDAHAGAVWLLDTEGIGQSPVLVGEAEGEELGAALVWVTEGLVVGAPGDANSPGAVVSLVY